MKNLTITPYVTHENVDYNDNVAISIRKEDFDNIEFKEGKTALVISCCNFSEVFIENSDEIPFKEISLVFFGCAIKKVSVKNIASSNISIGFYRSILSGTFHSSNLKSIEVNNCLVPNGIFITGIQTIRVSFTKENLRIKEWKQLFEKINIQNVREFICQPQSYYISDPQILYFNSNFQYKHFNGLFDINLTIRYNRSNEDLRTEIGNAYLRSLSISGNSSGKIAIENTKVSSWYISDFYPKEEVNFYNVVPNPRYTTESKISIHKSNLDNVWFDNVYFNLYKLISFYRTKFSKTVFTSCNFPDEYSKFENFKQIENVHYPDKINDNYPKDQYEIFIQLKKSLEATGNYYEAQKLQSIAHEALRRITTIQFWDRAILFTNRWSNNHGLSVSRPFVLFIFFSILFYILYLLSLGRMFNSNSIDYTLIGAYFSFIDITHRPDFLVEKNEFNGWSLFLDFFNKLSTGFFAYQFIAAFRKYGKN